MSTPLISVVVTVYNKEDYLADTVRSLVEQDGGLEVEYIFVDDVSTDRSLEVLEEVTRGMHHVTIIKNSENQGPSIRVNQGVRLARGIYVLCFDSDDILAANALKVMSDALMQHDADVVYGNWQKTNESGAALVGRRMRDKATIDVSDTPLHTVLTGRFLRMQFMARREVFLTAGGADERVFIQDESIPLRLAAHAKRWLKIHDTVMFVPKIDGALSGNVSQLNHDRFFAHYHMLQDYKKLTPQEQRLLYRRAVSAGFKQVRCEKGLGRFVDPILVHYLASRLKSATVDKAVLKSIAQHMSELGEVRRV